MIYLIGGSGAPNYGDELILSHWIEKIHSQDPTKGFCIETNIPQNTKKIHQIPPYATVCREILKIAKINAVNKNFWEAMEYGQSFFENSLWKNYVGKPFFRDISNLEVLHLHGGGYISMHQARSGFLVGFCSAIKKHHSIRLVATGLGLEPLSMPPSHLAETSANVFASFDLFECRDEPGYKKLQKITGGFNGLMFGLDDCYLAEAKRHRSAETAKGKSSFHISLSKGRLDEFDETFYQRLNTAAEQFDRVIFWECYPWEDKDVITVLRTKIARLEVFPVAELLNKGAPVSPGDFMYATRFHPHYVAARLGATGYFNSKSDYYDVKHESIVQRGSPFRSIDLNAEIEINSDGKSDIVNQEQTFRKMKADLADKIYGLK